MRVNVINLDRSEDRLTEFTTLNAHLADVARFPAIDGQRLQIASLVRRNAMSILRSGTGPSRVGRTGCESGRQLASHPETYYYYPG